MAKTKKIIQSFNAGELSPYMASRIDQEKYVLGCRTLENAYPLIYGGAERRPGTEFIASQKSSSAKGRVVGFEHSVDDCYVLLFENQVIRVFKDGAQVYQPDFPEYADYSSFSANLLSFWALDDNSAANNTVTDSVALHNGTVSAAHTDDVSIANAAGTANSAFDLSTNTVTIGDFADYEFGNGITDSPFTLVAAFYFTSGNGEGVIISKWDDGDPDCEWVLYIDSNDKLIFKIWDDNVNSSAYITTNNTITTGWHYVVAAYAGGSGANSANAMEIYLDWIKQPVTRTTSANYVAMEAGTLAVRIGADGAGGLSNWEGYMDNVGILNKCLTETEVASLTGSDSTDVYEITSPYLTADLPYLQFKQSADVMYITHPDYEPRKLSRLADSVWKLEVVGLEDGPFRDENTDVNAKITPSATTGSITLTATGCAPFVDGTTSGHEPSGTTATSKCQTGALFKLVHSTATSAISGTLDTSVLNSTSSTLTIYKGVAWDLVTNGTWGQAANSATVVLERSYDSGSTYSTVVSITSAANHNIVTDGTEEVDDAIYRLRVSEVSGATNCSYNLSVRDTSRIGIVKITAVASTTSATATVLKTLESTSATYRWSEGSFSNYRGWPRTVEISSEERLSFAGSLSKPLSIWQSVSGNYDSFLAGDLDDDALNLTLIGTGQQNTIQWQVSKDSTMLGTLGGEHLLGASSADEALTPSNVTAKVKGSRGSEWLQAMLVNDSILFLQRGGRKIRELANTDTYDASVWRADDLTVFSEHITESGIVGWAYQRTPDPMLWCVRDDGQIAVMMYERQQDIYSWARIVLGGTDAKAESVCVIYGGAGNEDEVWITVSRTVNSATVRTVERFKPRSWGSTLADAFFVDSGYTDTGGALTVSGLTHLAGETVQVFADGEVLSGIHTVSAAGVLTFTAIHSKRQIGLGYNTTIKPMKLDLYGMGLTLTKKITEGVLSLYKTIGGQWGDSTSNLYGLDYAGNDEDSTSLFTGDLVVPFDGGYDRKGDVIIYQSNPAPLTALSLMLNVGVHDI